MRHSLRFVGIVLAVVGLFSFGNEAKAMPVFQSLTVDKATLIADDADVQTAHLVVQTLEPQLLDEVNIIVNYPFSGQPNNSRGYFNWTAANGFRKLGGANYGAQHVNLLQANPANPLAGSERIVDTSAGTVTFNFRWTATASYGNLNDNDIWYHFAERTRGFVQRWTKVETNFVVTGTHAQPVFVPPFRVEKMSLWADGRDVQSASLFIRTDAPQLLDEANIIVNYPVAGQPNRARGYFHWTPTGGFQKLGGANFGANYVNLLPENSVNPILGSQRFITSNSVVFVFRWTANSNYGTIPDNDISYHFAERTTGYVHPWTLVQTNFSVSTVVAPGPVGVAVSLDLNSPAPRQYAAGAMGAPLAVFNFVASTTAGVAEDVTLTSLNLTQNVTDPAQASYQDYSLLYLVDANGRIVASAVPTSTSVYFQLNPGTVIVRTNDTVGASLTLKANLSNIGPQYNVAVGGHKLGYGVASPLHMNAIGMSTANPVSIYYLAWPRPTGATHIMYKGIPTVNILPANGKLSSETDIYRFTVSAGSSDIGLYKFTSHVGMVSVQMNAIELYDVTTPSEVLLYSASTIGRGNDFVEDMYFDPMGIGQRTEVIVTAGQTRTFVIRGRFGGMVAGSVVSTTLFGDLTDAGYTPFMQPAETINQSVENDFIWSDRHAWSVPHSTVSADWTNGYLVRGMNGNHTSVWSVSY